MIVIDLLKKSQQWPNKPITWQEKHHKNTPTNKQQQNKTQKNQKQTKKLVQKPWLNLSPEIWTKTLLHFNKHAQHGEWCANKPLCVKPQTHCSDTEERTTPLSNMPQTNSRRTKSSNPKMHRPKTWRMLPSLIPLNANNKTKIQPRIDWLLQLKRDYSKSLNCAWAQQNSLVTTFSFLTPKSVHTPKHLANEAVLWNYLGTKNARYL